MSAFANCGIVTAMKRMRLVCLIMFAGLLLVACGDDGLSSETAVNNALSAVEPTATLQPTPTLLPGLTQPPPTPPVTPAPAATATPLPSPSPTPELSQRLPEGLRRLELGDFAAAATHLEAVLSGPDSFSADEVTQALLALGQAYLGDGRYADAAAAFTQLLDQPNPPSAAAHLLGQALEGAGDSAAALAAYQTYLDANPDMAAYVNLDIARIATEPVAVLNAYEAALGGHAQRLHKVAIHQQLAQFYVAQGNTAAAIAQYFAIRDLAITEITQGRMTYLAGMAYLEMGNTEAAYEQFALGFNTYPRAYESYLGLVQLVEAGIPVDEFQRGLVDYYAGAYEPGIAAFERYLAQNPADYRADTHLFLAYTYEALGNLETALAQLDQFAEREPEEAQIERAELLTRAGDRDGALVAYQTYLADFPAGADAPEAAWWTAVFHERNGDIPAAITAYSDLAAGYPTADNAPEALFRAGWLANNAGDWETAVSLWWRTAQTYPTAEYGSAAIVWLLRTLDLGESEAAGAETPTVAVTSTISATETVTATTAVRDIDAIRAEVRAIARNVGPRTDYYGLRAYHVATDVEPFPPVGPIPLPDVAESAALQAEAETWLRGRLGLEAGTEVAGVDGRLQQNPAFAVGNKLWQLGRLEQAKAELETVRRSVAGDALLSYQLALHFRDIGLYRSSIIAASSAMNTLGASIFDAPRFLGQLAYPVYYGDMITALADRYGYDPRLQFSLVRQESLFESFARSGAAAQGLSQVIPDTGIYIASLLNWPDFENEDLYKPYVGLNFGAFYLDQQLNTFDGFEAAALSAYNAGPGNAAFWYERAGADHDLFVETVAFPETRLYIERIYLGYYLYSYLYGP